MRKNILRQIFLFSIFYFLFFPFFHSNASAKTIKSISYSSPAWLDNETILCVKHLSYSRTRLIPFIGDLTDAPTIPLRDEIQIVSMKIDGTEERVIKNIVKRYDPQRWDEEIFKGVNFIRSISYNPQKNLIAFNTHGISKGVFLIKDTGEIENIAEECSNPRFSPDGTKLMYTANNNLWLYVINSDKTSLLLENAKSGLWHPSGEKVYFYRSPDIYEYDLKTKKENKLFSTWHYLDDIYPDGTKILAGSLYDLSEGKTLLLKAIQHGLNYPRFSPDGKRIVGDPVNVEGSICIVDIDGTNFRVLR